LFYKYKSSCVSQKFKIYCRLNITRDALHQNKAQFTTDLLYISIPRLSLSQSRLYSHQSVSISSPPCHIPSSQWLIEQSFTYKFMLLQLKKKIFLLFNVWLTVHLQLYLYNEPTQCTIFHFILLPRLCMFWAIFSSSSGGHVYNVVMVLILLLK
jgi:hypothetical protein